MQNQKPISGDESKEFTLGLYFISNDTFTNWSACQRKTSWQFGNKKLYPLCVENIFVDKYYLRWCRKRLKCVAC